MQRAQELSANNLTIIRKFDGYFFSDKYEDALLELQRLWATRNDTDLILQALSRQDIDDSSLAVRIFHHGSNDSALALLSLLNDCVHHQISVIETLTHLSASNSIAANVLHYAVNDQSPTVFLGLLKLMEKLLTSNDDYQAEMLDKIYCMLTQKADIAAHGVVLYRPIDLIIARNNESCLQHYLAFILKLIDHGLSKERAEKILEETIMPEFLQQTALQKPSHVFNMIAENDYRSVSPLLRFGLYQTSSVMELSPGVQHTVKPCGP